MYYENKQRNSITEQNLNTDKKNECLAVSHIIMISEESCDTEDWINDAGNTALITEINYILTYIQI